MKVTNCSSHRVPTRVLHKHDVERSDLPLHRNVTDEGYQHSRRGVFSQADSRNSSGIMQAAARQERASNRRRED